MFLKYPGVWTPQSLFAQVLHDPVTMSIAAMTAMVGGSVISGMGQINAGKAAQINANFQANQLVQQAGQERASAQRVAIEKTREATIAQSNAQARAAASGGGAIDPTVLNITGNLAQQGEYNTLSALYTGEEKARSQELQATSLRMQGKQAKTAGMISGISTIASGTGNALMAKYAPTAAASTSSSSLPWQQSGMLRPDYMGGGTY